MILIFKQIFTVLLISTNEYLHNTIKNWQSWLRIKKFQNSLKLNGLSCLWFIIQIEKLHPVVWNLKQNYLLNTWDIET